MQRKKIDTPNHIPPYFVYDICFQENSETVEGGWKTESMLALQPGWDSCGAYYTMLFTYFQVMNPCIQITRCFPCKDYGEVGYLLGHKAWTHSN